MNYLKSFQLFESVNRKSLNNFLLDFGFLISLNFSQITKMGIDENATKELNLMMKRLRGPIINGKSYFELIDNIDSLCKSPKLLSALMSQIRELLIYIEPRVKKFVNQDPVKDSWISQLDSLKSRYKQIVT
jgi:hypothetical protein